MKNINLQNISTETIILLSIVSVLLIFCIYLNKKVQSLSKDIFSLQRYSEHKDTLLENSIAQLAKDLPIENHPHTRNKTINNMIESLLHKFSITLNKKIHEKLQTEQSIWNDKFSILLSILGKTEKDIQQKRDDHFKESWDSITELRQKSQLLFNDMQEDGIFYRAQSLWLLSNLNLQQEDYYEAFRYCVAAIKLYIDGRPKLPLSQKIAWKIGDTFIESADHLTKNAQQEIIKKFQVNPESVLDIFLELDSIESNTEILQRVRIWLNQYTQI